MICVITQPTFLPWIGWFDIVDQSDLLILLDDVQFTKRSWQQRNNIRTRNGLEYLTVPVKTSGRFEQRIVDCELANVEFTSKIFKTLNANYTSAPFFKEYKQEFMVLTEQAASTGSLVELNYTLIAWMVEKLNINTKIIRASELAIGGQRGSHLAEICQNVGADQYLSTAGAEAYLIQDQSAFDRQNITVYLHVYEHPEYPQCFSPFIPYASALDLIFNVGVGACDVMHSGRRTFRKLGATYITT